MDWTLYLAFVATTTALILLPGPNIALIVSNSIAYGSRRGLATVAGTSSAIVVALSLTTLGMTSLLLIASVWFEWLRWIGVVYLIYLGVQQWRAKPVGSVAAGQETSLSRLFWQGFAVSATNPKVLLFYVAFFPQFIDPSAAALPQMVVLSVTYLVIAASLDSGFALLAGRVRGLFNSERRARIQNRITGSLLIGAGIGLALARRP
ncbi:MAG: LysE family translocator [Alphaproteobacteria bacterium]|nr:LysE family translocator [Alphaproteobacteria bacterium]